MLANQRRKFARPPRWQAAQRRQLGFGRDLVNVSRKFSEFEFAAGEPAAAKSRMDLPETILSHLSYYFNELVETRT